MTDHRRDNIMPGKMRECDGCHKIMRSDNLKNHIQTCKELSNDEGDGSGDSQTSTKSETTEQIADAVMEGGQSAESEKRT